MLLIWLAISSCLASFTKGMDTNVIHVSTAGIDHFNCGGEMTPCRTIQFVFKVFNNQSMLVYIDGGIHISNRYLLDETVNLLQNTTIKQKPGSRFRPVIHVRNKNIVYALSTFHSDVTIDSIDFDDVNIIRCIHGCQLNLKNVETTFKDKHNDYSLLINGFNYDVNTNIRNCTLRSNYFIVLMKRGLLNITDTALIGGGAKIELLGIKAYLRVYMNRVNFTRVSTMNALFLKHAESVTLLNVNFLDNLHNGSMVLVLGKPFSIMTKLTIQNLTFINCKSSIRLMYLKYTDFSLDRFLLNGNKLESEKQAIKAELSTGQLKKLTITGEDPINVHTFIIFNNRSQITCSNWLVQNNHFRSLVVVSFKSQVVMVNLTVKENTFTATMLTSYFSKRGKLKIIQAWITNNTFKNNVLGVKNTRSKVNNVFISENQYKTALYFMDDNAELSNVQIQNNIEKSLAKSIYFNALREGRSLSMANISVKSSSEKQQRNERASSVKVVLSTYSYLSLTNITIQLERFQYCALELSLHTKRVEMFSKPDIDIVCQIGSNPVSLRMTHTPLYIHRTMCSPCPTGMYTMHYGTQHINGTHTETREMSEVLKDFHFEERTYECKECPTGGICNDGKITSRGNFYGFRRPARLDSDSDVRFFPCPVGYCCPSKRDCVSYDTCDNNRTGTLCGQCKQNYTESFFSTICIPNRSCTNIGLFWIFYMISILIIVGSTVYLDKFAPTLKQIVQKLVKLCCRCCMRRPEDQTEGGLARTTSISLLEDVNKNLNQLNSLATDNESSNVSDKHLQHGGLAVGVSDKEEDSAATDGGIETEIKDDHQSPFTFSGIISGLLSFYQIKSLLRVNRENYADVEEKTPSLVLEDFFNLNLVIQYRTSYCPAVNLTATEKAFVKQFLFNASMPIVVLITIFVVWLINLVFFKSSLLRNSSRYSFINRLQVGYLRVLLLVYKNISVFCLVMISCISINQQSVLFVQGNVQCYQGWQYCIIVYLVLWVIPFPFALSSSYKLYYRHKITCPEMMAGITFPFIVPLFKLRKCCWPSPTNSAATNQKQYHNIRQLFVEPYRVKKDRATEEFIFWEKYRLCLRLVLAGLHNFVINPIKRVTYFTVTIILFLMLYWKIKPFKKELFLLHWIEVVSLASLCYHLIRSQFNAFLYMYTIPSDIDIDFVKMIFRYTEIAFSPLTVLTVYLILWPIFQKTLNLFRKVIH